jgi:hypothetical protein
MRNEIRFFQHLDRYILLAAEKARIEAIFASQEHDVETRVQLNRAIRETAHEIAFVKAQMDELLKQDDTKECIKEAKA